jgi:predicted DsbA family dithiol-disulfide isomerase
MGTMIEVFADVLCPFTHVGLRRLTDRRDRLGSRAVVAVKAWPLEAVNGEPVDCEAVAEEVAELRRQVAPDLFTAFDPSHFPTTSIPALAVAAAAYRQDLRLGEQVSLALRNALFEQGLDISDSEVLDDVVRAHDLHPEPRDDAAVINQWHEGRRRGVIGSPHFFANGVGVFCPSLEITRVDGRLQIAADPEALEHFLETALA